MFSYPNLLFEHNARGAGRRDGIWGVSLEGGVWGGVGVFVFKLSEVCSSCKGMQQSHCIIMSGYPSILWLDVVWYLL